MFPHYIINRFTTALVSHFHNGFEYTQVLEGTETFLVAQSPKQIVENSFLSVGKTLDGAIEAARSLLNQKYKLPVVLSAQHHIALIRCPSINKSGTIWLVHSHIHSIKSDPDDPSKTIIYTNHGHSLVVDMKSKAFQIKRSQATFLHSVVLKNSEMNKTLTFLYEKDQGIQLIKETGQVNYTLKKKIDSVQIDIE